MADRRESAAAAQKRGQSKEDDPSPCAQLASVLAHRGPYYEIKMYSRESGRALLTAMVRDSALRRAGETAWPGTDLDIVQITAYAARTGAATIFLGDLARVGQVHGPGRGVFVEQTITPDSQAWCKWLVCNGAAHQQGDVAYGVAKDAEYEALCALAEAKRRGQVSYGYRLQR